MNCLVLAHDLLSDISSSVLVIVIMLSVINNNSIATVKISCYIINNGFSSLLLINCTNSHALSASNNIEYTINRSCPV